MSNYLIHYGVKGMKWGVRNEETRLNRNAKKIAKLEKYRTRMASKNTIYALRSRNSAKNAKSSLNDLKKNRYSSKTWQNSKEHKALSSHVSSSLNPINMGIEYIKYSNASTKAFNEMVNKYSEEYTSSISRAKKYESINKRLMDMPISATTTKKDIKKIYKGK